MKTIQLNNFLLTKVDDADFVMLSHYKWHVSGYRNGKGSLYAVAHCKTINGISAPRIKMHRLLTNAPEGVFVDHIDGDGLNNQRENLRLCTRQQNVWNRRKQKQQTSSKFKGVAWSKWGKKWRAVITAFGKKKFLGYYTQEEDAAKAYDNAAQQCFGSFARLNFSADTFLHTSQTASRQHSLRSTQSDATTFFPQ